MVEDNPVRVIDVFINELGRQRELIVDQLCADAQERGITIVRDKKVLGVGDRISKFISALDAETAPSQCSATNI